jgi:hypothetical protein
MKDIYLGDFYSHNHFKYKYHSLYIYIYIYIICDNEWYLLLKVS